MVLNTIVNKLFEYYVTNSRFVRCRGALRSGIVRKRAVRSLLMLLFVLLGTCKKVFGGLF